MQHLTYGPIVGVTTKLISSVNVATVSTPILAESHSISIDWSAWSIYSNSDASWCITYTDGWMEQGGYKPVSTAAAYASIPVTFGWSFSGSPVFIKCQPCHYSTTTSDNGLYGVYNITESGFIYNKGGGQASTIGFYWLAKGINPNHAVPQPVGTREVQGDTIIGTESDTVNNNIVYFDGGTIGGDTLNI